MVDLDVARLSFQQFNCTQPGFYLEQAFVLLKCFSCDASKMSHSVPLYIKYSSPTDSSDIWGKKITSLFSYFFCKYEMYFNRDLRDICGHCLLHKMISVLFFFFHGPLCLGITGYSPIITASHCRSLLSESLNPKPANSIVQLMIADVIQHNEIPVANTVILLKVVYCYTSQPVLTYLGPSPWEVGSKPRLKNNNHYMCCIVLNSNIRTGLKMLNVKFFRRKCCITVQYSLSTLLSLLVTHKFAHGQSSTSCFQCETIFIVTTSKTFYLIQFNICRTVYCKMLSLTCEKL